MFGLEGVFNISDDIIIFGKDKEHDMSLMRVLQRLEDNWLKVNLDKCEFRKDKLEYFGIIISS